VSSKLSAYTERSGSVLEFSASAINDVAPGVDSASNTNEYKEYFLGRRRPVRRADNLTNSMCRLSGNLGASTSWNPQGLSGPVQGLLYLHLFTANDDCGHLIILDVTPCGLVRSMPMFLNW